jgi:hypothetical protein
MAQYCKGCLLLRTVKRKWDYRCGNCPSLRNNKRPKRQRATRRKL